MKHTAEIFDASIVVLGNFNPAIFSPDWLERNELIGKEDGDDARSRSSLIVSQQVTSYETDWFFLQVLENQFTLMSKGVVTPAFRDLAEGILTLVPHTPVTAVGVNFMSHFHMPTQDAYYKVGDVLAPKQIWRKIFPEEQGTPGVLDLMIGIQQVRRGDPNTNPDVVRIQLQPSAKIAFPKYGIFLSYNDHRAAFAKQPGRKTTAERAAEIIAKDWEGAWKEAVRVFDALLTKVEEA